MKADLVAVQLPERGLVVFMTRQQRDQFFQGVDRDAAYRHDADLEDTDQEEA